MDKTFLFVGGVFWLTCIAYVLYYYNKHYRLTFETVFFTILLAPIIALIMKDPAEEELKEQQELNDFWEETRRRYEDVPIIDNTPKSKKVKDFKFFQK